MQMPDTTQQQQSGHLDLRAAKNERERTKVLIHSSQANGHRARSVGAKHYGHSGKSVNVSCAHLHLLFDDTTHGNTIIIIIMISSGQAGTFAFKLSPLAAILPFRV